MRDAASWFHLLRHFVVRDLRQRYLGSLWGGLWALIHPLLLLAIYAVVFVHVLEVRLPADASGRPADFVPFLVAGLWPWTLFADGLNRGTAAIPEAASLLAKVAMPRSVLVLAPVTASFVLHLTGFVLALGALFAMGKPIQASGLPAVFAALLLLLAFCAGLALAFAALNVFLRDLAQLLAQALTLLFFLTPIFYTRAMVPDAFRAALDLNPLTSYVELVRGALLGTAAPERGWVVAIVAAALALALGGFVFRRLSRHFEDFL